MALRLKNVDRNTPMLLPPDLRDWIPDNQKEVMKNRLESTRGRELYKLRKQTVEPVFGIIKSAMGFTAFSLRGLQAVQGEWDLVTLSYNIKHLFNLKKALG
ncbi:MAG: transposase [Kiritimatiellae bacterium]|nr:transposase [Kiritimatiellia bacterium]MDD4735872.1 transposase [Kiritimatiellia bacterium]